MTRRWNRIGLAMIASILLAGMAMLWSGALDRLIHRQRYATSGVELLAIDRYAAAAQARALADERVAQLRLPDGRGPVTVALAGTAVERVVYLDPPTARVLDAVAIEAEAGARRLERPVLTTRLTAVMAIDSARALVHGEAVRVSWPTERRPDWLVELDGDGAVAAVAVADDAGVAVALPGRALVAQGGGWPLWPLLLGAAAVGAVVLIFWRSRARPRVAKAGVQSSPARGGGPPA